MQPAADAGCFWNYADKRHFTSYDDLIAKDVCQSGSHYSLELRRLCTW
jgi:hypothetical protein